MKFLLLIAVWFCVSLHTQGQTLTDSNLPIVIITTQNNAPIIDDPRVIAHMGVIDNGAGNMNNVNDPFTTFDGRIEIEIRGSTSQQYPKKGYGFETQDSAGFNLQVALLGMPPENDWILHGPYPDKTLIRNVLTFDLSRQMGHYAPDTRFCELIINGDYRGVYVAMERIKIDNNRVNLQDLHQPDVWGDTLTGGYIVKVDKLTGEVGYSWTSNYNNEVVFQFHDPEFDELSPTQVSYMENHINSFEDAINGPQFADPNVGWPYYIDATSFYDFFILQELGRTVDGYRSSSFLHKDKNALSWNSRMRAGPMWDFNLSFGNADYCGANTTTGWQYNFDQVCDFSTSIPFWWKKLLQDPNYENGLRCRWEELREGPLKTENINNFIDSVATHIEDARIRNFQRWPIIGVYINWNGFVGQTYEEDLQYLKTYMEQRSVWIDNNLGGTCTASIEESAFTPEYHKVWPNPFTNDANVGFSLFDIGEVSIHVFDVYGRSVQTSNAGILTQGTHVLPLELQHLERGNYMYQINLDGSTLYTGKIMKK
ncbi:MAG: CotH kinase family protein [Crocinitomicaceae bacterium]|nr:CotH kinase family protein [Crocinitomicaceae bacterium]